MVGVKAALMLTHDERNHRRGSSFWCVNVCDGYSGSEMSGVAGDRLRSESEEFLRDVAPLRSAGAWVEAATALSQRGWGKNVDALRESNTLLSSERPIKHKLNGHESELTHASGSPLGVEPKGLVRVRRRECMMAKYVKEVLELGGDAKQEFTGV